MKKILLLNSSYEVLQFITERKAIRLLCKGKVDIVSSWADEQINIGNGNIYFPSTLKMKYYVNIKFSKLSFSRKSVFKRDFFNCQYCGKHLKGDQATIDHINPRSLGGDNSFDNCVTACYPCNSRKGNKTLQEANMELINSPIIPLQYVYYLSDSDIWHTEWDNYFNYKKVL